MRLKKKNDSERNQGSHRNRMENFMKKNMILTVLISLMMLSASQGFANEIACHESTTNQIVMRFRSNSSIPDYSFESFKFHSSYGEVTIHGKTYGETWLSITNGGFELFYEIKLQNTSQKPLAYIHLSLDKSGIFNGYQQSDEAGIELLNCTFEN